MMEEEGPPPSLLLRRAAICQHRPSRVESLVQAPILLTPAGKGSRPLIAHEDTWAPKGQATRHGPHNTQAAELRLELGSGWP